MELVAYSDYLCPWCYNGSVRLRKLEAEFEGRVRVEFRSYLLRPEPRPRPPSPESLERFRSYTRSWLRPAEEEDAGSFRVWEGDAGPPSHSIPPHLVAKAAAQLGDAAFRRVHERLLQAYFAENRDVSEPETLLSIWREAELPDADFAAHEDPALHRQVLAEHAEAQSLGISGVPSVMRADQKIPILGALPMESYRRWVERALAEGAA